MVKHQVIRSLADDLGQDLVEYALLLTFIALVCIAALQALGEETNSSYDDAAYNIETADAPADDAGATPPGKRKRPKKPKP